MSTAEFFDRLATTWDEQERPDMMERLARVTALSQLREGERVLDVGTGTGVLIPLLRQAVGSHGIIVALDISRGMLRQAAGKGLAKSACLVLGDMHCAGLRNEAFDCVICNAVFPHFTGKQRALREAWRVLRPGGRLVISHPIGREAVNRVHSQYGAVAEDRVPSAADMYRMLYSAGWEEVEVIDEPEFYLARAKKPV